MPMQDSRLAKSQRWVRNIASKYHDDFADALRIAICKFSEPIAFNSVIAYTFPMSKWLNDDDPTNGKTQQGKLYMDFD